jgi:hypothetical protein
VTYIMQGKTLIATVLPVAAALAFLWFPFDWLSEIWPAFGVAFRILFRDSQGHFIGHTVFFFLIGSFALNRLRILQRKPIVYIVCVISAALIQEAIQAVFRHEFPRFNDFNAFKGDALGSAVAFMVNVLLRAYIVSTVRLQATTSSDLDAR